TLATKDIIKLLSRLEFTAEVFDLVKLANQYVGKPYGDAAEGQKAAYTCGALTEDIYRRVGLTTGHHGGDQWGVGIVVELSDLRAGDLVFRRDGRLGQAKSDQAKIHVALYLGKDRILHAKSMERNQASVWEVADVTGVVEEALEVITTDPDYLGARRIVDQL